MVARALYLPSRRPRTPRFLALSLGFALGGSPAFAEEVSGGEVRVVKNAFASDCPGEIELVRAALALGRAPAAPAAEPVLIDVVFDGDEASIRALVVARGSKSGNRELKTAGRDCKKLADSVAVVLAVLLDLVPPDAVASFEAIQTTREPLAPPPPPLVAPPLPPKPRTSRVARPTPAPAPPIALWFRADGGMAVGPLGPVVSPLLGGSAGLQRDRWQLGVGGAWLAPRQIAFDPIPGTEVDLSLAYGSLEGCYGFPLAPHWDAWACALFSTGVLTGAGENFDHDETQRELWLAAGPRGDLRLRLGSVFSLRLALAALVTLGERTFIVDDYGEAFTTTPVSATVTLGVELTIN